MPFRARTALAAAFGGVLALVAVYVAAYHVAVVRWADAAALDGFTAAQRSWLVGPADRIASLCDPVPFAFLAALVTAIAVARGRLRLALAVPIVLMGANLTTQLLKPALAMERGWGELPGIHVFDAAWPSGHATASMSLALCLVLVTPAILRPLAGAIGAAFAIAVCYSLLSLGWHFPSDVVAGYLVAATWMLFALAALAAAEQRWPAGAGREAVLRMRDAVAIPAMALVAAGAVGALVVISRPDDAIAVARDHTVFVASALLIAALGITLASGLAAALRR